jgi:hypothetical protein
LEGRNNIRGKKKKKKKKKKSYNKKKKKSQKHETKGETPLTAFFTCPTWLTLSSKQTLPQEPTAML